MVPDTEEDRKKKKEEKARLKEEKKQKAAEKAEKTKLKEQQVSNASKKSAKKNAKREADDENPEDFVDPETPLGEKKRLSTQMAKQYSPTAVEKSWYAWWEELGFFQADAGSSKPPFVIDTIIRWRRMSGYNVLWVPGMDHAGIATQVVVEKKLKRERSLTRHDIGREEFVNEVWKWKNKYGGTILRQLRRMGAFLDWSLLYMDEKRSKAVTEAFCRLYEQGLIYRDLRLVNWDCVLRTAISDIEVVYKDIKERTLLEVPGYKEPVEFGVLTSFAYPLEGELGEIVVATTRVETMLGDTAIAIHPDDKSKGGAEFFGMKRFEARKAVIEALQKKKLYRGAQNNEMQLGRCSRSNDVVEPLIKPQWYVNCSSMAKQALDAAIDDQNKKLEFIPKQYNAEWKSDEMKELGAYNDHWIVARDEEQALAEAKKKYCGKKFEMSQDPDVLDTWFSSGLFPLSVLGWPDDTDDLKAFYPTSVLETGHDILFFWVARMVMLGITLGGDVPFRKMAKCLGNVIDPLDVINGISLEGLHKKVEEGNLDPNEFATAKAGQKKDFPNGIAECGADALRFALVSYTAQYQFCDVFIEAIKPYLAGDNPAFSSERKCAQDALWVCLENGLRLLHPFMPFVTEELWQRLPGVKSHTKKESIMICEYPSPIESWTNEKVEIEMDLVESTVRSLRSLRAQHLAKQKNERLPAFAFCQNKEVAEIIKSCELEILTLATLSSLKVLLSGVDVAPAGCAFENVNENLKVYLKVQGNLNAEAELEKIRNKLDEIQKQQEKLNKIMNASGYQQKVPSHIQEDNANKLAKLLQEFDFLKKEEERLESEADRQH
ncbi:Aminoacyl-tRNA synthetase, class Ia [Corchorus olitorius]|uniref:valine--tRNA ligase n=1 Tax=Corchorus olitorius TaxID=93759 RepID=A0A1R3H5J0_9ROSI|nr:Aminoacyl-tRNA synthetase, class Ia [Corchorus olitorius]